MAALPPIFIDVARKPTEADKSIISGDTTYMNQLFATYNPTKMKIRYGYCIEHNATDKEITVEEDIEIGTGKSMVTRIGPPPRTVAKWGRPNLGKSEVINKRVKISYTIQKRPNPPIIGQDQEEYVEILLHAIKPDNAPSSWEFDYA